MPAPISPSPEQLLLRLVTALLFAGGALWAPRVPAQQLGGGQAGYSVQEQRELDAGGGPSRSTVLDATNPIDLMNRIRRATAMDDATPPGDAVDAALRDFNAQPAARPASPGSSLVQGP
jgi:hypothetical protein